MLDNFELIKPLLNFSSDDDFYYAIILQRKKEHSHLGSNSYQVKSYFIKSLEDLEKNKEEMIGIATLMNARVYINLNRRSFETMAFQSMRKIVDQIMNKDYKSVKKAYTSVCGSYNNEPIKRWIIDIDDNTFDEELFKKTIFNIAPIGEKFIVKIPTKNGYHLITKPYNIQEFGQYNYLFPPFDIQKDNPTLIFCP